MSIALDVPAKLSHAAYGDCACGADCTFIQVGDRGLKCYNNSNIRDRFYRLQRSLAAKGLAPACDDCVEVKIDTSCGGRTVYAFWSVCADVACDVYATTNRSPKRLTDRDDLKDRLLRAGYSWLDIHDGNWGYINGRAVLIDVAGY